MNEEELLELCSSKNLQSFKGKPPYWASEVYGFGKYIRNYAFYPKRWPLILFTEHSGPVIRHSFNHYETSHDAPTVMLHSPARVNEWRKWYDKPCYTLYSPFVFYRKKNSITQSKEAKGTLAYPTHTIPELDITSDMNDYILKLKNLPDKYQPISVSLHYHDINKGLHKLFLRHNIPVYTAGNPFDYRFTERFYSVLKNFRYTTSDFFGSYAFYSVEMNIPFFLHGESPKFAKNSDSELAKIALDVANTKDSVTDYFNKMFNSIADFITPEQKELVEITLGLRDGVSRFALAKILYLNYFKFYIKTRIVRVKRKIKLAHQ